MGVGGGDSRICISKESLFPDAAVQRWDFHNCWLKEYLLIQKVQKQQNPNEMLLLGLSAHMHLLSPGNRATEGGRGDAGSAPRWGVWGRGHRRGHPCGRCGLRGGECRVFAI